MEEIAFSDWPGQPIDGNPGANSWLPAYGFQTPSALLLEREDFLGNPDADYFLQGTTPCLYLETIHEETSDDLRSDSDLSDVRVSPLGWLASDSEADSVICMETNYSDCESDREIACPIKRRRQDNFLPLPFEEDCQSLSRSSSLLQFETLEKQCQEGGSSGSPSIYSQFSLDSLERREQIISQEDQEEEEDESNLNSDSSDSVDSETTLAPSKSYSNLRTWHSSDNIPHQTNNTKREKISVENLSEDSGYSDHMCNKLRFEKKPKSASSFGAYDYCEAFQKFGGNLGVSCQNLSLVDDQSEFLIDWMHGVNIEKQPPTSEYRAKYKSTWASEPNLVLHHSRTNLQETISRSEFFGQNVSVFSVPKNLNLIGKCVNINNNNHNVSSIAAKNWDLADFANTYSIDMTAFKREGSYAEAMRHRVDLSDDEQSLCYKKKMPKTTIVEFDKKVLHAISESIHSINSVSVADAYLNDIYNAPPPISGQNKRNVASTPNLVMNTQEQERFLDLLLEEDRRRSVQDLPRKSSIARRSTSTSNVSDNEDRILAYESGSSKGVHFSPVVSEVNWNNDSQSTPSTAERESSYSLSSTPERDAIETFTKVLLEQPPRATPQRSQRFSGSQPDLQQHPQRSRFRSSFSQSQPDVRSGGLKRRGSLLVKKDVDGCIVKAYIDNDGVQYKHTHLDLDNVVEIPDQPQHHHLQESMAPSASTSKSHVAFCHGDAQLSIQQQSTHPAVPVIGMDVVNVTRKDSAPHHHLPHSNQKNQRAGGKLGGFFQRLASFRFSNRKDEKNKSKKKQEENRNDDGTGSKNSQRIATKDDYIYIPLKGPSSADSSPQHQLQKSNKDLAVSAKPPLPRVPPRVVGASVKRGENAQGRRSSNADQEHQRRRKTIDSGECPRPMEPMGLIETDLDTEVTVITSGTNVKTRSLQNLGAEPRLGDGLLHVNDVDGRASDQRLHGKGPRARPHKSMEFLLDKQNLKVVEPPENDLQKTERVMSEHQLRVQRSLQKLTVPDWYKQHQPRRESFLLKKPSNREIRWTGTSSKTTSLSSLGSGSPSPIILSPTSFVRWSTSKLNSTASSPCASTRSSFNARQPNGSISPSSVRSSFSYRQPYLGWRSQERLNKPRTPAERLANSLLSRQTPPVQPQENPEIQTSIKEVTSAIVHYVSGLKPDSSDETARSRSVSPKGSQKLCWLESSFVGIRPLDSPQTPLSLTENQTTSAPPNTLRLELQTHNDVSLLNTGSGPRPSPSSTTLEDVLDSLLGLPSSDRAPSPSLQVTVSANTSPHHSIEQFRRRSEGNDPATPLVNNSRRVSFQSSPILQCRYSRCARIVSASSVEAVAFKNCHNCSYTYCSRTCRRAHWEKHRKTCLFSRIGSLCRQVIAAIKEQKDTLYHLSLIARRGYLSHGHGAVKCFFPCFEAAEKFLSDGLSCLGELTYIRWPDLLPSEMGPQLYSELVQMCKHYNPDTKLILYVSICVVSETPSTGIVKWERQLVSRCAKMKLSKEIGIPIKDQDNPETLILTCQSIDSKKLKKISVENVQKHLRMRGVSLKRQHPVIFKQLSAYIEDRTCEELTPITLYPTDATTGKSFMCIIMLGANPNSLRQVESAGVRVRTINMLQSEE